MNLDACLPPDLRGPGTTITPITAGLSGAGVWRIDAAGRAPVMLKVSSSRDPLDRWRQRVHVQECAASAGVAPRVVHVDEARRAVVTAFVDGSFVALYGDPRSRATALTRLGQTLRQAHALPLDSGAPAPQDPLHLLAATWSGLLESTHLALPPLVGAVVESMLAAEAPARERALVLSHNDVNPGNLVVDGERLLLVDWEHAEAGDPYYDLATIAVFLAMDDDSCAGLLAAYDAAPIASLPAGFRYARRLVAVFCGTTFLTLASRGGYPGATEPATLEETPGLIAFYQQMRAGALSLATGEGQWAYGLALLKESVAR